MHDGAAEHGDGDRKGVGAVGVVADPAGEAAEAAADDTDGVVGAEDGGSELYLVVGLAEHEAQGLHLGFGDYGGGGAQPVGGGHAVDQEAADVGEGDDPAPLALCAFDEYHRGDDDAVDHAPAPVLPQAHLLLCGHIAHYIDIHELVGDSLFMAGVDPGDVPFGAGYAFGAVNAPWRCR